MIEMLFAFYRLEDVCGWETNWEIPLYSWEIAWEIKPFFRNLPADDVSVCR